MKKTILIATVMLFALSTVAMAQNTGTRFTVASVPETYVSCCGQTERTGSIGFQAVAGSPDSVSGTITVTYAVPVTNGPTTGINVTSGSPTNPAGGVPPAVSINTVFNDTSGKGVVVINVDPGGVYPYSITLSGVRVDVSGSCSGSVSANLTSTGNFITSGETSVVVISNVKPALKNPTATALTINGVTGAISGGGLVPFAVQENFLDAFGKTPTTDPTQTVSKIIRLTVTKVPAGVTLTFPLNDDSGLFRLSSASGTFRTTAQVVATGTAASTPVYYRLLTDSSPLATESLDFDIQVALSSPSYPLSGAPVTISAHVAPIDATNTVVPRFADFAECETTAVQILSIYGASTTLLVPYAVNQDVLFGYNTGFAIANTTTDPGTGVMGFATAVKQAGAMTFYFYPQTGSAFSYATTAGSPGSGLNADGTLKSGGSYIVLLDQLLNAASAPKAFTGYIFIVTNFTNAHGQYFISDFEAFTNGALMLVVNNSDTTVGRAGPERLDN